MSLSHGSRSPTTGNGYMRSLTTFDSAAGEEGLGRLIPRPDIPVQPVISWNMFASSPAARVPGVIDQGRTFFVTAARIAIAHALELSGLGPGHKVLVPAYHCVAMIEPIVYVGADPVFYRLRDDLSVDLDDVAAKIDGNTRAFIAVNYFGFPQDLPALRRFCDERALTFIEDCAHSFFGSFNGRPLGSFGHFAVASLTKFFPVRDGGALVIGRDRSADLGIDIKPQSFSASAATALHAVDDAVALGRLRGLAPILRLIDGAKNVVRSVAPQADSARGQNPATERSGLLGGFNPAWMGIGATAVSRAICRHAPWPRIAERRRHNYARLAREFSGLSGCRPVFPQLPDGVVPYMFPLWVDRLAEIFPSLEDRAVPMQRFGQFLWPIMDQQVCPVTQAHSRHSVQLACHQELSDDEITAIVERVRALIA